MSEKSSISALVKRFREAPPSSPGNRINNEDEKPRYQAPPQPQNRSSTNYSDIVRSLRKSNNGSGGNGNTNSNTNNNHNNHNSHDKSSHSPATSYAGLGGGGGGDNDDFIAREIRQLKRDMHFDKNDQMNRSMDSTSGRY